MKTWGVNTGESLEVISSGPSLYFTLPVTQEGRGTSPRHSVSRGQSWGRNRNVPGHLASPSRCALQSTGGGSSGRRPRAQSSRCPPGPPTLSPLPPQVNLVLGDGRSLGLTIRGGAEYGLGIYVTGVDPGSEAESSGLKVRDP